jgi:CTP synthase (UTP-ammonia lyase)
VLVEHARTNLGIARAVHAEYGVEGDAIVSLLACSLNDQVIGIDVTPGSKLHDAYGALTAIEATTCNYGLEPAYAYVASSAGLRVAAIDDTGEVRAVEHADHPFFVGTLFQPQLSSTAAHPHPIWLAFIRAIAR